MSSSMKAFEDYYTILQVEQNASADEIKASYRNLAFELHPDRNKAPDATEAFQRIGNAWDVLGDSKSRSEYDVQWKWKFAQRSNGAKANHYTATLNTGASPGARFTSTHAPKRNHDAWETSQGKRNRLRKGRRRHREPEEVPTERNSAEADATEPGLVDEEFPDEDTDYENYSNEDLGNEPTS